jgi:glycosyltransferase involved in cell wall biosynthesis
MVTPYPPTRDGVANYAVQEVKRLRAEGHDVEVLSPGPSAAHHHLELRGVRGGLALAKRVRGYDRVIVQFHPAMFFPEPSTSPERAAIYGALAVAWRAASDIELRVHEFPHEGAAGSRLEAKAGRAMWQAVDHISVHTEVERELLASAYGISASRIAVVDPGANFERRTELTQDEARLRLGLDPEGFVFLSIGFLQPHKGFDRAVRAFGDLGDRGCRLEIVGSLRVDAPEYVVYLEDLRELVDETDGVTLHEEYVSDAEFDVWIVAADALVLPYRLIWSSSVCERASLYQRPLIASRVGGLEDQTPADAIMVDSDRGLAEAMQRVAGLEPVALPAGPWPGADRAAVMREIRSRAGAHHSAFARSRNGATAAGTTLRRMPPLRIPGPRSVRPGVSTVKWIVRLLTAWELDPVVHHVNRLQQTVTDALAGSGGASTGRDDQADGARTPPRP